MTVSIFGKEDFQSLLEAWGDWSFGLGCNLQAVSGTQLLWSKSSKGVLYSVAEVENVERAMLQLRAEEPELYEVVKFRYYSGEQKSILDLELRFKISNRKACEVSAAGEYLVMGFYYSLKKVS